MKDKKKEKLVVDDELKCYSCGTKIKYDGDMAECYCNDCEDMSQPTKKQLQAKADRYETIVDSARDLYDNRLGWSDGRNPYAHTEFWEKLRQALDASEPDSDKCEEQETQPRYVGILNESDNPIEPLDLKNVATLDWDYQVGKRINKIINRLKEKGI